MVSSRAIVLNKLRHTDSTTIVTLYTEHSGSVAFALRQPKTSRSKIKPQLFQPLTLLQIEWAPRPNSSLQRLQNASLLLPPPSLYPPAVDNMGKAEGMPVNGQRGVFHARLSLLSEALHAALRSETTGDTYPFIHDSLVWLSMQHRDAANFHLVFLIRLAYHLGILPQPDSPQDNSFFDLQNAEYTPVQPHHNYFLHPQDAQNIPLMLRISYPTMHLLRLTPDQRYRTLRIILAYYRLHLPAFPQLRSPHTLYQVEQTEAEAV